MLECVWRRAAPSTVNVSKDWIARHSAAGPISFSAHSSKSLSALVALSQRLPDAPWLDQLLAWEDIQQSIQSDRDGGGLAEKLYAHKGASMNWLDNFRKSKAYPQPPTQQAQADREARVQIYDAPTGTLTTIPARELAPGIVRIQMDGVKGDCWMNPDQLTASPYQHPPFDEDTHDLLRRLKEALDEVYPMSLEAWEDGFRRDRNAENEIAIWLHIAEMYKRLTEDRSLTRAEKGDVFRLLLACANNPRDQVLATAGVQTLSRPEVEAVMAEFYKD